MAISLPATPPAPPKGTPRRSRRTRWRVATWLVVHVAVLAHIAHWRVTGTSLSPLEPSEAMETLELGYVNAGFLLFALLIVVTLVVGRFFCGWACHVVAYQDACAALLARLGLKPKPVRSRVLLAVPLGAAFYMFAWPTLVRWLGGEDAPAWLWHLTTNDFWKTFPGPGIAALTFLVDGALIVWLMGAKGFCTYGCPYGALFGLADRASPGRIVVSDACEGCGHCTATCTSRVDVRAEVGQFGQVVNTGCMKCLDCVDVCPKDALSFAFAKPPLFGGVSSRTSSRPRRTWDFTAWEETALAVVFLAALYASRNLYGLVPFLLALGLSVIAAVVVVALPRLLRAKDATLQHVRLRRAGSLTVAGWIALAGVGLTVTGIVHSGTVQFLRHEGERRFAEGRVQTDDEVRLAALGGALIPLKRAERLGLLDDHELQNLLALTYEARGEWAHAEAHLRRAVTLAPSPARWVALATLHIRQGEVDDARSSLDAALRMDPEHAEANQRRELVRARTGR